MRRRLHFDIAVYIGLALLVVAPTLVACGDSAPIHNQNNANVDVNTNDAGPPPADAAIPEPTLVGSAACQPCHATEAADHQGSGHPFIMQRVSGAAPGYPHTTVPDPPAGTTWAGVTYVVGGYGRMARFLGPDGYLMAGAAVEWAVTDGSWQPYDQNEPDGKSKYDCGGCHTVGWVEATDDASPHQDGLAGIIGTFFEAGVGCEACHGPGSRHVATQAAADIVVDRSPEACGRCHSRSSQNRIEAEDGFLRHRGQYDEILASTHGYDHVACVDCHHPHRGVVHDPEQGLRRACTACHTPITFTRHGVEATCVDCHMPYLVRASRTVSAYQADQRTHLFAVRTTVEDRTAMFYEDGGDQYAHPGITLDLACYGCHQDLTGLGGAGSQRSLLELSAYAAGMHTAP